MNLDIVERSDDELSLVQLRHLGTTVNLRYLKQILRQSPHLTLHLEWLLLAHLRQLKSHSVGVCVQLNQLLQLSALVFLQTSPVEGALDEHYEVSAWKIELGIELFFLEKVRNVEKRNCFFIPVDFAPVLFFFEIGIKSNFVYHRVLP
jgi:hypothetical protein